MVNTKIDNQRYHRPMSEKPPSEPRFGSGTSGLPIGYGPVSSGVSAQWSTPPPVTSSKRDRWLTFAVLALALLGLGVGLAALFRPINKDSPASPAAPAYTSQQVDGAKANVCEAYGKVKQVVTGNTHRTNPVAGDPVGALATGIYAPVSLYDSGDYLLRNLSYDKAAPEDLAKSIESFGKKLLELAMVDLAGDPDSARDSLRHQLDADVTTIDGLCK
jgi:hypothetical protein